MDRLNRLEKEGIILKRRDPDDRRQFIYTVTEKGASLVPVLLEIAAWGASHDTKTDAPSTFAERFYTDRDKVIAEFSQGLIITEAEKRESPSSRS